MSAASRCRRRVVVQAPEGYRVESCSCGLIHVTAGPVTLRLERAAFTDLVAVLALADAELTRGAPRPWGVRMALDDASADGGAS